jgi:hypothetical protein
LVSDVELNTKGASNCAATGSEVPGAYDLFGTHSCDIGLRASTASLLAARFPYVTPSGVIRSCADGAFDDQVIDGGYSENTGIDTANAIVQQLMPSIRATNARAADASGVVKLVVPIVMYLHNTVVASSSTAPTSARPSPEFLVPPTNLGDTGFLGASSSLLQRAANLTDQWAPDTWPTDRAKIFRDAVTDALPERTMTIAPQQKPQIALPLGWAMSRATESSLDVALDDYLKCTPKGTRTCEQSQAFDRLLTQWGTAMAFPPPGA